MTKITNPTLKLTAAALESLREMADAAYACSDPDDPDDAHDAVSLMLLLKWYDGREARDAEIAAEAAKREREACIEIADRLAENHPVPPMTANAPGTQHALGVRGGAAAIASIIRARQEPQP